MQTSSKARETRDSVNDIWGNRTPFFQHWTSRVDEKYVEEPERWVQSACLLCSNGCALDIGVRNGKIVGVRGREQDRVNRGRLGPKGLNAWMANNSPDRLTAPLIRKNGSLQKATWDEAMSLIVDRSKEIIDRYTSSAIGFYTTGQLFLEEYYTLAVIGKAGLGTPHMDGNTRLCTATAAASLMESFGADGQPGSYEDLDVTDAIFHVGHNIASQQTVLWMRILDRLSGPRPPKIVVVDPRKTFTAEKADVHLAPRLGTNVAVMDGLIKLIIDAGQIDRAYIEAHTTGFETLQKTVSKWTPKRVEEVSKVPSQSLKAAAEILGGTKTLVSTVLQGVYQSMQATSAAVQVNNLHLIRGLIGKPGCGILQMNGQPTAQNTRETGDDGALSGFRNWANPKHIEQLAKLWNVEQGKIPHWSPPTHAMQIFRYAEMGSIKLLCIICTNPAVSLPELARVRKILSNPKLFVVVQDAFLTETAKLADVVLPAAIWGEKTGCMTNVDRTVHISYKAVEPPGEAKPDIDIFLDYARRMDLRDKDHAPLIKWNSPEGAFEAWKQCTQGRPVDYTGLSYAKLTGGSGIQWPCNNEKSPQGTARLYTEGVFATDFDVCETFGHDLETGAAVTAEEYKAKNPRGKAFLKAADYKPPHEQPNEEFPFFLTTGRVVHHFHTRTKTGRSEELNKAAPNVFAQVSKKDADQLGISEGSWVRVESRRGFVEAPARIGGILEGHVFVPFHYGYWDNPGYRRAANEMTITEWDPVSKQPHFKYAAVRITPIQEPKKSASSNEDEKLASKKGFETSTSAEKPKGKMGTYIGMVIYGEKEFSRALTKVGEHHKDEPDIFQACTLLLTWSKENEKRLEVFATHYKEEKGTEPEELSRVLFKEPREGGLGLLRDLQDLYLFCQENYISWTILLQASQGLHDKELKETCDLSISQVKRQLAWLTTRIKQAAPQALVVPS